MTNKAPTRVVVVSDQAIYLRGLASFVMSVPDYQLIGEARSGPEAVQLCQMTGPDIVLLDLKNFQDHGEETVSVMRRDHPALKVILLLRPHYESWARERFTGIHVHSLSRDIFEDELRDALEHIREDTFERVLVSSGVDEEESDLEIAELRAQAQAHQKKEELISRELTMAGKIQADILPEIAPEIPGWDIVAKLQPARETSGDFYDFIPLGGNKWGIAIADVSDKGMGAALFMALSSSLLRTYATRFPTLPAVTLNAVSERILSDTRGGMFVTAFFGTLETHTGRMVFANAGHPPGFVISTQRGKLSVEPLRPTGMALGVSEDARWKQKLAKLLPGDFLVLYTDGVTEAQNSRGSFFGEDRLLDAVLSVATRSAREITQVLIDAIDRFLNGTPRQDDIAVLVIKRKN